MKMVWVEERRSLLLNIDGGEKWIELTRDELEEEAARKQWKESQGRSGRFDNQEIPKRRLVDLRHFDEVWLIDSDRMIILNSQEFDALPWVDMTGYVEMTDRRPFYEAAKARQEAATETKA